MTTSEEKPIQAAARRSPRLQLRRSVQEFLWLPLTITLAFALLGVVTVVFETVAAEVAQPAHDWLARYVSGQTAITLLASVAGGMVTLTSITFTVLLLAIFQTATAYSGVVVDQFLRRTANQVYFGFFVGLTIYAFLVLAFANPAGNPALGAAFALLITVVALGMLLLLVYRTIDQMRPANVALSIRNLALEARGEQLELLARSRAGAQLPADRGVRTVSTVHKGYLVGVEIDKIARALDEVNGEVEVVFHVRVGHHVVFGDTLCDVRGGREGDRCRVAEVALEAITLENLPNVDLDPGYAVDQLMNVAWTTGSSSQQDPEAAMAAITAARDLVSRWTAAGLPPAESYGGPLPVVYQDDVVAQTLGRLASLLPGAVGADQHQTVARIVTAFALMLPRLVPEDQSFALDVLERALPAVAHNVRTHEIHQAIRRLQDTVRSLGFTDVEKCIENVSATFITPWQDLRPAVGSLPDGSTGR